MTPKEVLALCKSKNVQLVDVKFCDFLGTWQHFCCPISELEEEVFEAGLGFDGSSIRGWKSIEASDMLLMLDPATAIIDPFPQVTTLSIVADAVDTITHEPYSRTRVTSPAKLRRISSKRALPTRPSLARRRNSSFSTMSVSPRPPTAPITTLIPAKASGTAVAKSSPILATRFATRKATSLWPRRTHKAISVTK